jgi:lysophospholipase L1-like esterase
MKVLFLGDSLTSAENNNYKGFVEKLRLQFFENKGVSGSTIGDYSLYPVGNTDLLSSTFKYKDIIAKSDYLFIEYGINDIASATIGYTTNNYICITLNKCIDNIYQINKNIKIVYLLPTLESKVLSEIAKSQYDYLKEYLDEEIVGDKEDFIKFYMNNYYSLVKFITRKKLNILTLIDNVDVYRNYLDVDMIHPNDKGYQIIADKLRKELTTQYEDFNNWIK